MTPFYFLNSGSSVGGGGNPADRIDVVYYTPPNSKKILKGNRESISNGYSAISPALFDYNSACSTKLCGQFLIFLFILVVVHD
jgi:hypothetical protein